MSPILFTIYTNDCVSSQPNCSRFKFADDTAIASLLFDSEIQYKEEINDFVTWCRENFLELNVSKTKELIIDFRKNKSVICPVVINGDVVEVVSNYKYLGTVIDNKLNFSDNTDRIYKKCQSRLHFLRKLRS